MISPDGRTKIAFLEESQAKVKRKRLHVNLYSEPVEEGLVFQETDRVWLFLSACIVSVHSSKAPIESFLGPTKGLRKKRNCEAEAMLFF